MVMIVETAQHNHLACIYQSKLPLDSLTVSKLRPLMKSALNDYAVQTGSEAHRA